MKRITITVENTEDNEMETFVILTDKDVTAKELESLAIDHVGGRPKSR